MAGDRESGSIWGVALCLRDGSQRPAQSWPTPLGCSEGKAQTLDLLSRSQTAGYAPPTPFQPGSPTVGSPPRPLGMHFGPMSSSLDPALFFSPSAMGQLNLR